MLYMHNIYYVYNIYCRYIRHLPYLMSEEVKLAPSRKQRSLLLVQSPVFVSRLSLVPRITTGHAEEYDAARRSKTRSFSCKGEAKTALSRTKMKQRPLFVGFGKETPLFPGRILRPPRPAGIATKPSKNPMRIGRLLRRLPFRCR